MWIIFTVLSVAFGLFGVWNIILGIRIADEEAGKNRPQIVFISSDLLSLGRECQARFNPPLKALPQMFIARDEDFESEPVLYLPGREEMFFKPTYLKDASPEDLKNTMLRNLLDAWIRQHKHEDGLGREGGSYKAAAIMFGIDQ